MIRHVNIRFKATAAEKADPSSTALRVQVPMQRGLCASMHKAAAQSIQTIPTSRPQVFGKDLLLESLGKEPL